MMLCLLAVVALGQLSAGEFSKIECGFEDADLCGYTHESSHANTAFIRNTGQSYSRALSTTAGVTSSSEGQWYVYLDCHAVPAYEHVSLISPEEEPVFKKCLQFSYNMHGSDVFILKVFMKTALGWGDAIWTRLSNKGTDWLTATFPITSFQPFQIVFQAHSGTTINCDIGVDDVKIIECPDEVLDGTDTHEPWTEWKKCDQTCGANYRSRARFWFSRESKQPYNFTYHIRYSTADKHCPEKHRWYFDNFKDDLFPDEYGKAEAMAISGSLQPSDGMLAVKSGQESVRILFPYDPCILGVRDCSDGFTLSYWTNLRSSPDGSYVISPQDSNGLKITVVDSTNTNISMESNGKHWNMKTSITTQVWTHVTVTWSKCHGLTYYENGLLKKHSGVFETMNRSSSQFTERFLYIGKNRLVNGAMFSMIELVMWDGILSPKDIKALYLKGDLHAGVKSRCGIIHANIIMNQVDQAERFMFLKNSEENVLQWKKRYTETPSNNTGPNFSHLRSEFDIDNDDDKPSSCEDILLMGKGNVDGYYVIFPRGACRDFLEVWCSGMSGSLPKEYIDVDPAMNYAINAGLNGPCQTLVVSYPTGKTWFDKIRLRPDTMTVDTSDNSFVSFTNNFIAFGSAGACYRAQYHATCSHTGVFNINLRNTSVRVKPTVNWKVGGWWPDPETPKMVNFRRSPDNREISANCGAYCGRCFPDGDLLLELSSCVEKKPRSCGDIKHYRNISEDGNYTIYPYPADLVPVLVYCAGMTTPEPKEYINVLNGSKNFAFMSRDKAQYNTCNIKSGADAIYSSYPKFGHSRFSKIRLDALTMEVIRSDYSFSDIVFGSNVKYASGGSCFSRALCKLRGFLNIDLTGTGLRIKPSVVWKKSGWPDHFKTLSTIHEDFYRQIVNGNCGGYCGFCQPVGPLYLEVSVPSDPANLRYFGEKNFSLVDTSDQGKSGRNSDLSKEFTGCYTVITQHALLTSLPKFSSKINNNILVGRNMLRLVNEQSLYRIDEPVGVEDGRIPDGSISASSINGSLLTRARLGNPDGEWKAKTDDKAPWLQIDMLFVRLVTGVATQTGSTYRVKTYLLSFGFDVNRLTFYEDDSEKRKVFVTNVASEVEREVVSKPFFARFVRFVVLTWNHRAKLAVEIFICPRATYHHIVSSDDFHFLEASYPGARGDHGDLVTRIMPPMYTCMKFKYHMIGSDMGRLDVYIEELDRENRLIWSLVGEQSPHAWKKAAIPLDVDTAFRMIFVGVIGDGYKSDIAVGGVSLMNDKNCTFTPSHAMSGPSCVPACMGRSKCDNVTGKCVCLDKDFVDEKCQNQLLQTIYKDALHYWSFDNPENLTDLKTGVKAIPKKPVSHVSGPVNLAFTSTPTKGSGLELGDIKHPCLREPSVCPQGLTISAWIKIGEPRNRVNFFSTISGGKLGVVLVQYRDGSNLVYNVHGTKHKCFMEHSFRWGTWMFVSATWAIKADGIGVAMLYINDDKGVTRDEKSCPERSDLTYATNLGTMSTSIQDTSAIGYWLDELTVWNTSLPEHRIVEIYNLVTRNPSNHFAWTFELKSYPWSRKLVDRETVEHKEETGKLSSLIGKYIDNILVTKIWEEFQTDRCIYAGSVRSGVATWREDVFLPCNDMRFKFKYDNFHMKLRVKNGAVDVKLNNINLGSFSSQGYVARGGIFATSEANSDEILVRNFNLEVNPTPDVFSYEDCDTTESGPRGDDGEYVLYGTQMNTPGDNCMAIHKRPVFSSHYNIEVKLRHDKGDIDRAGFELSHMGVIFKYKSKENFVLMILRLHHSSVPCFDLYHYDGGVPRKITGGSCPADTKKQTWHSVSVVVDFQETKAYLDGTLLFTATLTYVPLSSKVGVAVYYKEGIIVSFKDFHVEEYFVPVSSFPDTRSFQLSRIEGVVEDHSITSIFGGPVISPDPYAVSADFYSSTGAFGLCYNVIDDSNFDFVYYRRNRVLFAEVVQSVLNTSWEQNEILHEGIENSSFILTAKSSRKVPTHVPFNVSSFAINSTALNISWNWAPDYDVTGLFQGFRILYRNEEEFWEEKIVYGQEFENSSWVIINDLRKSMEYSLKVVAFSLVGDGWPSKEILNSTMDDTPDMVDLNVTIRKISLQSAFVAWDLLPEHHWNGDEPSYIVVFQDIVRGKNITIHVPAGTNQLNYTEFRHFTNYSVSLMALNNVGSSLPTNGSRLETPEYVPAVYPANISVTTLNTSALTMSWDPIDDALWQGLPLGYVIFCNHSDDYRNFTVGLSTLEIMMTNLTAFTFYDVTVAGYTGKGLGPKHPTIMTRTHEEAPRYAPINLRVLNRSEEQTNGISDNTNMAPSIPTSYSTTIEWDPVPADQVRGIIRGYTISYEPVEVHYITRARRSLTDRMHAVTLNSSTASIELDNLLFYTNYSLVVWAFTVSNGVPSSMFHFMTPEGVPRIGPGNLNANHDGSKSKLTVTWNSIPIDARNGILLGYHVYYHETSTSGHDKNLTVITTYAKLIDLETYTSYDIRVCGFTAVGDGVCGEVSAMTRSYDMAHYTPLWNATTVLTSPVSISLIWTPLPEALWFDHPRGYHITIQRVALGGIKTSGDDVITVRVGYKTGSYMWINLEFYAQYKIEISTITYRGFGPKTVLYGDTCQCPSYMTSTFQVLPPYVIRGKSKLVGVLPEVIRRMTSSCCVTCGGTVVDFDKDGFGEISEKGNYPELLQSLDQATTFAFPIVGYVGSNTYSSNFGFVPGVESPGMVVIVKKKSAENIALTVMWSVFGLWPILVINVLLALIAGIVMWMLDSSSNENIFPRTCIRGCLVGFWWAFISMTTVGYGDTTAKTVPGRIFAVIWVLTGLCLYSVLIGDLSSALSTSVSVSSTSLYGAKVAVLINSSEESVAIRRNAKIYGGPYYSPYEIQKSLLSGDVDAAILDIYAAALTKELWNHTDLRISQILDYSAPYGIVMAGGTNGIQRCFQSYVQNNRIKTLELVLQYTSTIQGVKREETSEYVQDLIDGQSSHFRRTLLILCIILGILFLFGAIWMFIRKTRRSMIVKKENSVHPVKIPDEEILNHLGHSYLNIYSRLKKMKKRHGDEIRRFKAKALKMAA